ncbi:M23 family metallopeptidase [Robiginitalea marina]|uniref:M23 family metallopeptidase n=1 Tax=Robiginitalea marina TaxID=2954105 RepID=A0ABT1B0K4_9FLAO|nr:M23 family metallopeptidase [Robiginitalea marina]MCO5724933.1 M23 family metallopeptidase [Robiginitalea marina]
MQKTLLLIATLLLVSCAKLRRVPNEQYYAFRYSFKQDFARDTLSFSLKNPLRCPVNIQLTENPDTPGLKALFGIKTLRELQDTVIKIPYPELDLTKNPKISYIVRYGDLNRQIEKNKLALPFPKGREYKVIQGYNGKLTHNTIYSRFALDFKLSIGDTITSADDGYVVGIIEDYKEYGTGKKWLESDKSNYITLYHPQSGLFTQYVHLTYKGALVKMGDFVEKGQPVGISGMTGYTTTPHLHFNAKVPTHEHGLASTEIEFENGIRGKDLKKGDRVK